MAEFIDRERWCRQPNRPVPIDPSHPLASSLRFFIVFINGVPIDLQSWAVGTRNGSAAIQASAVPVGAGTVAKLASASSDYYEFAHRPEWEILGEITLAWRGRINSGSGFRHFVGKHTGNGASNTPFDFRTDNGASPKLSLVRSGGSFSQFDSVGTIPLNVPLTVEVTKGLSLSDTPSFYSQGVDIGSTTSSPGGFALGTAATLRVGRRADGAVQMDGFTEYVAGFASILSADALREFRLAPYALLLPPETPVTYSLGGGGDQTITVSDSGAGSDTITIGAALSIAETGAGTDALSIGAALALADSGTGTDGTPSITVAVTLTDAGTGTETFAGSATIALTDSGSGSDALSILTATLVSIADSATGSDAVAITVSLALTDAGTGTEGLGGATSFALADTGAGSDAISVVSDILKAVADVATGTDAVSITVQLAVPDTGAGLEALGISAALAVLDQGTGYDVVVNSAPGLAKVVSITFTARTRRIAFSATSRTINFTMH